jgi:hypothetical protein
VNVPKSHTLAIGSVLAISLIATACFDTCGNRVLFETVAPGNQKRAVLFERDCGATTGFSTHVSLLDRSEVLPRTAGNVFIADSDHGKVGMDIHIHWDSRDHLVVNFPGHARVFQKRTSVKGIQISYLPYDMK